MLYFHQWLAWLATHTYMFTKNFRTFFLSLPLRGVSFVPLFFFTCTFSVLLWPVISPFHFLYFFVLLCTDVMCFTNLSSYKPFTFISIFFSQSCTSTLSRSVNLAITAPKFVCWWLSIKMIESSFPGTKLIVLLSYFILLFYCWSKWWRCFLAYAFSVEKAEELQNSLHLLFL